MALKILKDFAQKHPKIALGAKIALLVLLVLVALKKFIIGETHKAAHKEEVHSSETTRALKILYQQEDELAAAPLLKSACKQGDMNACYHTIEQISQAFKPVAASELAKKAVSAGLYDEEYAKVAAQTVAEGCENNSPVACYAGALMIQSGLDMAQNPYLAPTYSASDKQQIAMLQNEANDSWKTSAKLLQESCKKASAKLSGSAQDCYLLAKQYANGYGVEASPSRALGYAEDACRAGYAPGCYEAAKLHAASSPRHKPDEAQAIRSYAKGCELGYAASCRAIVKANSSAEQALQALQSLCEFGGPKAADYCLELGDLYSGQSAFGGKQYKDEKKAEHYYDLSCKAGNKKYCK